MKVLIGILTRYRLNECLTLIDTLRRMTRNSYDLVISVDRDPMTFDELNKRGLRVVKPRAAGAPANRNRILAEFKHSDAEVLFKIEDDCLPAVRGWEQPYLDALQTGPSQVLLALNEAHGPFTPSALNPTVGYRTAETTQLMVMTRLPLYYIGAFNQKAFTDLYGCEDGDYMIRCNRAKVTGSPEGFPCLRNAAELTTSINAPSSDGKSHEQRMQEADINGRIWSETSQGAIYIPNPEEEALLSHHEDL